MNVVIAIVITAGLSVLVGFCYGNERYREGFNRGAAKEREAAEKDYNAGYSDGYRAGEEKGKKESLQEATGLASIPYTNTILLHRTETLTLEEEHETRRTREELINWHTSHLYERLLNDAKRAVEIIVYEPNADGETKIEGRLVVTLRG